MKIRGAAAPLVTSEIPLAGLIWSENVNSRTSVGLLLLLFGFLLMEDEASGSRGRFERGWISLIFAGRNRIIVIRRELPQTVLHRAEPVV
jgi:hypothetical protein